MTDFVTVAQTHELAPGERLVAEVQGTWVIVFNIDGAYFAVEDMCSHEEYYLAEGALEGYSMECPKHGACFDVRTGQPLCPPAVSPIKRYAVRVEGDQLQVGKRL
ncbi:MAG: non-heme iron oxygenase ferredoxin subunit [Chloroflexi bacterium]|nr:non-heme iron oxygenase ferredoxin subunit [Chloroflexota bacterium]